MAAHKGHPKSGGRVAGTPNKTTKTVKEAFTAVFRDLQKDPKKPCHLKNWAKNNPTEFYKLASKLIPADITSGGKAIPAGSTIVHNYSLPDGTELEI